jgi:succinate-semialdehyde dehydrogenase/glutarate-semialdehyde dehydrogenase
MHDDYVRRLKAAVATKIKLGDPFETATTLGPMNNEPTAAKMDRHIADAIRRGARVISGGGRAKGRPTKLYYEATVLDGVTLDMEVAREETFGPIAPIVVIKDEGQALDLINQSEYGLLAAVFTRDLKRALKFAEAARVGWVNINESTNWWELHLPFGGRAGSRSGFGRVGGRHIYDRLTELKTIIINLA